MAERLECDVVMRGGITSGIVYPRAIAKLAETYDFRCIGGTSAGAIAAAGTAAAALGKSAKSTKEDPFQDVLKTLPNQLGETLSGKTRLERLFQPQKDTQRLFRILLSSLGHDTKLAMGIAVLKALLRNYWFCALIVPLILLAVVIAIGAFSGTGIAFWAFVVAAALLLAAVSALSAAICKLYFDIAKVGCRNFYGLCLGSSNNVADEAGVLPLTDWLNDLFQRLAGKDRDGPPVTFGDLWGTCDETEERKIDLLLMTTNVTRGVSHRLPFIEGSWGQLFFKEDDFRKLFPDSVVDHMIAKQAPVRAQGTLDTKGCIPLPAPGELPIVFGARLSLSFPFLLSAVPLYAANFETKKNGEDKPELQVCWFSDGGLTSNFPIHFFDSPLPSRPTFGINLMPHNVETSEIAIAGENEDGDTATAKEDDKKPSLERVSGTGLEDDQSTVQEGAGSSNDAQDKWKMIWMPCRNSSGIVSAARFTEIEGVGDFFSAMFDTARNWADTELIAMPGYRERVVHVKLTKKEGGLNLNMGPDVIADVADRGERAGELLVARYAPTPNGQTVLKDPLTGKDVQLTWDNHRWIRYRTAMAAFEDTARQFVSRWETQSQQTLWRSYSELLTRDKAKDLPKCYPFTAKQWTFADQATKDFVTLVAKWQPPDDTFDRGKKSDQGRAPRPKPALRMMPLGSNDPRAERPK